MADMAGAYQALEHEESEKENRTGFTRYSQGSSSADALNPTATGINIITNRSDERMELIARVFAETGVKELFLLILKLVSQYQKTSTSFQVNGQWLDVNPREWTTQFGMNVNVGLGTGNKDQIVQHLMALGQKQIEAMQFGYAQPENLFNLAKKLTENLGLKQPELYFTDPAKMPQKQAQASPEQVAAQAEQAKMQAQQQKDAQEIQARSQQHQIDAQLKERELVLRAETERYKAELAAHNALELERTRGEYMLLAAREKAGFDASQIVTQAHVDLASQAVQPQAMPMQPTQ
jgi:hypothetical protein